MFLLEDLADCRRAIGPVGKGSSAEYERRRGVWNRSCENMEKLLAKEEPSRLSDIELFNAMEELWQWVYEDDANVGKNQLVESLKEEGKRRLRKHFADLGAKTLAFAFHKDLGSVVITISFDRRTFDLLKKKGVFALAEELEMDPKNPHIKAVQIHAYEAGDDFILPLEETMKRADFAPRIEISGRVKSVMSDPNLN